MTFLITNVDGVDGPAWDATYATHDQAICAIMDALGWSHMVVSDGFTVRRADGRIATAWCVYPTKSEHDADLLGTRAPRILRVGDDVLDNGRYAP